MNHIHRFDGKGKLYAKARPKYAVGFFDYLRNTLHVPDKSTFADIGSGTGIFAEQLLQNGYRVLAVEPNGDMRKKAEEKLSDNPNFVSVNGCDGNMNLPDKSADFITAAQAFHWFDADAFGKECRRVLKKNGMVFLVYNKRDENADSVKTLAELYRRYNPDFHRFSNGINDAACRGFFTELCDIYRTDNTPTYDRTGYINRVLSSSYSLKESDGHYVEYLEKINEIFDTFSVNGTLSMPTETVAYIGKVF